MVQDDELLYVLVPVDEYRRLMQADIARSVLRKLKDKDDPAVHWIDADEAAMQFAGQQVTAARKAAGLTQKELAAKLKVPQSQISRIERHPDQTTVRTLKRLAEALGVDVRHLIH